jgi:hypothetical protein
MEEKLFAAKKAVDDNSKSIIMQDSIDRSLIE